MTLTAAHAEEVVDALRSGIPPQRFVTAYSSGLDDFLTKVRRRHFESSAAGGRVRFISGSWGSGKTHMLRLLAEQAFDAGYWVSNFQLNKDEAPFHKFEHVFFRIVRGLTAPSMYRDGDLRRSTPFGEVLRRGLVDQAAPEEGMPATYARARARLLEDHRIDIDLRRIVDRYWSTFTAKVDDPTVLEEERALILQWFSGEGTTATYRRHYGVQKVVDRANAHLMLQSLCALAQHLGAKGVVVLVDEAEMSFSTMSRTSLKQAHNNLLHLINSAQESDGLVLVYATVPDFYDDPRHGIKQYGALANRIGQPQDHAPRALDVVWNIDAAETGLTDYRAASRKLKQLYETAYDEEATGLPTGDALDAWVEDLVAQHPQYSQVSLWRVLITSLVRDFDDRIQGGQGHDAATLAQDVLDDFAS